jgi:FkbM family methyltransferase
LTNTLKRQLARRYPQWLGAYHRVRHHARIRQTLATTPHGFLFAGHQGMETGAFEPHETRFLLDRLPAADVYVDVGANVGYYVCLAQQARTYAIAIEPAERNLELLYQNLEANGWSAVEVFPMGVGREPGLVRLYGDGTSASTIKGWAGVSEAWHRTIPVSSLDILLAGRFVGERLLIKVDVEGGEHAVLGGAVGVLARHPAPTWLVEICFAENRPAGQANPHFRDTFESFWRHGYQGRALEDLRVVDRAAVDRWLAAGRCEIRYPSYVFEKAE